MIPHALPTRMAAGADLGVCPEIEFESDINFEDVFPLEQAVNFLDYFPDFDDTRCSKMITGFDCKLPGCDPDCERNHEKEFIMPGSPTHDLECVDTSLVFGVMLKQSDGENSTELQFNALENDTQFNVDEQSNEEKYSYDATPEGINIQPYTPDNDHCYYQPIHLQNVIEESNVSAHESVDSESPTDSSDDEVDVVTVTSEEYFPSAVQKRAELKRRAGRQQRYKKRQPVRSRRSLSISTVKAAATVLKRTASRFPAQSVKRSKTNSVETSPSSSLPSSGVNSLCGSDVEDFEKRNTHNDSERRRREIQRTALQDLRVCVPELVDNSKASKLLILNSARILIEQLETDEKSALAVKKSQLRYNKELKAKKKELENLRASLIRQ